MENQSNPFPKTNSDLLGKGSSKIQFKKDGKSLQFRLNDKKFSLNIRNEHNIKNSIDKYNLNIQKNSNLTSFKFHIDKAISKKIKLINDSLLNDYLQVYKDILKLNSIAVELELIPQHLLKLERFKNFTICQIYIHEKGQSKAKIYTSEVNDQKSISTIATETFNSLFQTIKKSKSKNFNSFNFSEHGIESLGTFLAKEFSFQNSAYIIILSRNEFLPPSKDEVTAFEELVNYLLPVIYSGVSRFKANKIFKFLFNIFEYFPMPLQLIENSESILFSNLAFRELDSIDDLNKETIELKNQCQLAIYFENREESIVDIYHFQKVGLLGELLNTLGHELSNPLFGLDLAANILSKENTDLETAEFLNGIQQNVKRSQSIIKNFSNLYKENIEPLEVDIIKIIEETLILTKSESKQIRRVFEYEKSNSPLVIRTNPTWVSQIIFNLLINSSQAIKEKEYVDYKVDNITIVCKKTNKAVEISITDSGSGIGAEDRKVMFDPFYTTKKKGTGLGLNISKNLSHKLSGDLIYDLNYLQGTRFVLTLPL